MSKHEDQNLRGQLEERLRRICDDPTVQVGEFEARSDSFLIVRTTAAGRAQQLAKVPSIVISYGRWDQIDKVLEGACSGEELPEE